MVSFSSAFLLGLLAIGLVQGAAIDASTVNPSAILQRRDFDDTSLPQKVRKGRMNKIIKEYQPYLKVFSGCVPFPAVDANGNTQ